MHSWHKQTSLDEELSLKTKHGAGKTETAGYTCEIDCVFLPLYHLNEHRDSMKRQSCVFLEKKTQLWNLENLCHF